MLNEKGGNIAVKNCGVVGAGLEEVVDISARESPSLPPGSLVIYGLVLNDFGLDSVEAIKGLNFIDLNNGGYTFNPIRQRSAFINLIFHVIDTRRLHTATTQAYLETFEGESAERGFELLGNLYESIVNNDHRLFVVVFPFLYDFENYHFQKTNENIAGFCRQNEILYLDLLTAFSRHDARELWANPTDHHPNEIAHAIAADEIAAFIENELGPVSNLAPDQ